MFFRRPSVPVHDYNPPAVPTSMPTHPTFGDFLQILTAKLAQENLPLPLRNERPWHELFYTLKKSPPAPPPPFLARLRFDWNGPYPKCRQLSEFLRAMHCNVSVSANNPTFATFTLQPAVIDLWTHRYKSQDIETEKLLLAAISQAKQTFPRLVPTRDES